MKNALNILLVFILVLGFAGTAFAGPFTDVPTNHWSYDAIGKLAKAGIIDGYDNRTYHGEKNLTRYEMAMIVGKAMEHADKADAQNKALIEKLAKEYADELKNLGVRVNKLEDYNKNTLRVGFDELIMFSSDNPPAGAPKEQGNDQWRFRTRILLNGDLNDKIGYSARITNMLQAMGGSASSTSTNYSFMDKGYVEMKDLAGFDWVRLGRMGLTELGGMVAFTDGMSDGVTVMKTFPDEKILMKAGALITAPKPATSVDGTSDAQEMQFISFEKRADKDHYLGALVLNNNRNLSATQNNYGYTYSGSRIYSLYGMTKVFDKWHLTAEASRATLYNPIGNVKSNPRAYEIQLTNGTNRPDQFYPIQKLYVDYSKGGNNAFMVSYRYSQSGAIPYGFGNAKSLIWLSPAYKINGVAVDANDNVKTWLFGYQHSFAKGVGMSVDIQNLKNISTGAPMDRTFGATLWFLF